MWEHATSLIVFVSVIALNAEDFVVLRSTPDAARAPEYFFEVRSGLYQGTRHRLGAGRHVMGRAPGADLLLVESSLADAHAAFVLSDGLIRVEGLAEGVSVEGVGHVPPGSARTVPLPAAIVLGDIRVVLGLEAPAVSVSPGSTTGCSQARRAGSERLWRSLRCMEAPQRTGDRSASDALRELMRRPVVPAVVAVAVLTISMSLTVANPKTWAPTPDQDAEFGSVANDRIKSSEPASPRREASIADGAELVPRGTGSINHPARASFSPSTAPTDAGANPAIASRAAEMLADEVQRAGLLNIHVTQNGATVVAVGSVEPAMSGSWTALQQSFDELFRGDAPLVNSVVERAEKLPAALNIEGVWRGRNPYIVVGGQRYALGARLDGGWSIREIERDRVILEHDGRLVAMRY